MTGRAQVAAVASLLLMAAGCRNGGEVPTPPSSPAASQAASLQTRPVPITEVTILSDGIVAEFMGLSLTCAGVRYALSFDAAAKRLAVVEETSPAVRQPCSKGAMVRHAVLPLDNARRLASVVLRDAATGEALPVGDFR